jgi:hypothetical protein
MMFCVQACVHGYQCQLVFAYKKLPNKKKTLNAGKKHHISQSSLNFFDDDMMKHL